jgi:hypothetical protein
MPGFRPPEVRSAVSAPRSAARCNEEQHNGGEDETQTGNGRRNQYESQGDRIGANKRFGGLAAGGDAWHLFVGTGLGHFMPAVATG